MHCVVAGLLDLAGAAMECMVWHMRTHLYAVRSMVQIMWYGTGRESMSL